MANLLFPIAALFLAVFLVIIYFSKKHSVNSETKIYSKMLIVNLIYALLCIIGYWYAKSIGNNLIVGLIQKIYMIFMLLLIIYIIIYNTTLMQIKEKKRKVFICFLWATFLIFAILTSIMPIHVINQNEILDGNGMAYNIVMIATIFYFLLIIISSLYIILKNKESFSKNVPFIVLIILYLIGLIVRNYMPSLMFENFFFSFMLLIMYFTIENPDVKMLNELTLAKNALEQANNIKTEFISSMSHEIRTPLNAIVGFSELAKEAKTLQEARENYDDILNASYDLLEMMNKMFELFSLENENLKVQNAPYQLVEELDRVIDLFADKIRAKNLKLKKEIDRNIPMLQGDKEVLKKILIYILDNAYKYTEHGVIILKADYKDEILMIKISDTGIGMKSEDLKTITEPFSKSSLTKNTSYRGMGLGLAITKNLIELLDGKFEIHSEYQKGTEVIIKIKQKEV